MAITADWQGNVRSFTFGAGLDWWIDDGGIKGLGVPSARTSDGPRGDRDGDVGGVDTLPRRVLSVPLVCGFDTPALAWASLEGEVKPAWSPGSSDEPMDLRLSGMTGTERRFYGRCRGITDDLADLKSGKIRALATFEALDPLGYGAEDSDAGNSGTFVINNAGTAPTDRITLTITGNGGTPVLSSATDASKAIRFGTTVSGTRVIDVRSRTVLNGTTDAYADLSPTNQWFDLLSGDNSLTLTGAASVDVTWRPAWF